MDWQFLRAECKRKFEVCLWLSYSTIVSHSSRSDPIRPWHLFTFLFKSKCTILEICHLLTYRRFFLKSKASQIIQRTEAHLDLSSACAITLARSLDLLSVASAFSDRFVQISSGSYRLLHYAAEFWVAHCSLYASTQTATELGLAISSRLAELYDKHERLLKEPHVIDTHCDRFIEVDEDQVIDKLKPFAHMLVHDLMKRVLHVRWLATQHECENGKGILPPQRGIYLVLRKELQMWKHS